jgi:ribonucleoside-diphosphate reductase alpha chain
MTGRNLYEEDLALKHFASQPADHKPRFDWRRVAKVAFDAAGLPIRIKGQEGLRELGQGDIADTVGSAVTDLCLSQNRDDIFSESNRSLVARVTGAVVGQLLERKSPAADGGIVLSEEELIHTIESALEKHHAYDVARSFIIQQNLRLGTNKAQVTPRGGRVPQISTRVIRRNGDIVAWNPEKIEGAVRKSFLAVHMDSASASDISDSVTRQIGESQTEFIHIEDVQDRVQEELMRQGHYKAAESYILFRQLRRTQRAQEEEETAAGGLFDDPAQESMVLVRRSDGSTYLWDGTDLRRRIAFARRGLDLNLRNDEIEFELRRSVFPEMSQEDLDKTIGLNAKSLIEKDADFSRFAGRILSSFIYEEVLGWNIVTDGPEELARFHREGFRRNLERAIEIERINPALAKMDLETLASALDPSADLEFDYLGIQSLYDRYLLVDKTATPHRRLETPQFFWMRVSMGIFYHEENNTQRTLELYQLYKSRRFCSSTPTLFNAGTVHSQLSSCYLYKVDDSLESIMLRGVAENASLSKWAGGLGGSWTAVRGTGGYIKGTNGESQGVIPFLKLHNDQLVAVNQGGKRKGSGCAYLETWHNDILDFLELRRNVGDDRRRTHDMNTANWVPDLFMKRMEDRANWTLFRSNEVPDLHETYGKEFESRYAQYEAMARRGEIFGHTMPAIDLWKSMLRNLFETGHPWITFKDPCNVRSPQDHVGVIHSSNLCTEITLNTSEDETAVCNLGSVVLDQHIDANGKLDLVMLRETIRIAVRALDNVIDINFYPTKAAETANMRHRPIGLGVMGLQNVLYGRDVSFASQAAIEFNDEMMEAIAFFAYEASSDLAAEKGTYSTYKGSKWDRGLLPQDTLDLLEEERGLPIEVPRGGRMDWTPIREKIAKQGMRNSNVIAIAPTATISNIMGSTPCIEPLYKNLFSKSNLGGEFTVLNPYLVRDLQKLGLWNQAMIDRLKYHDGELSEIVGIPPQLKEKFATAFAIPYEFVIDAAARRQKWIDQSQSVNLFLARPDMKLLSHMYRAAWRKGLKTTYYLRTLGASGIDKISVDSSKALRGVVAGGDGSETAARDALTSGGDDAETAATVCRLRADMTGEECISCT